MNDDSLSHKRKKRFYQLVAVLIVSLPVILIATTLTDDDLTVYEDADIGSGTNFNSWTAVGSIGYGNTLNNHGSLAVGSYLEGGNEEDTMVVGRWNKIVDALFVVGIGSGTEDKRNAIEIYPDDTIIVNQQQADIALGQFGQ